MAALVFHCPACKGDDLHRFSKRQGKDFYKCANPGCTPREFRLEYVYEEPATAGGADDALKCPSCEGENVRKFGKKQGTQIYRCNNSNCIRTTFRREYTYKACTPEVKEHVSRLAEEGNSARAIGRMLSISKDTVLKIMEERS
ncbi:MAG: hypothetical protein FWD98_05630 [Defluviitaleaceae bacterium]|nr:hypothetical protein [Defluviitaleaceae bacterium]